MLKCDVKGCKNVLSEILSTRRQREAWFIAKAGNWPQMREGIALDEPTGEERPIGKLETTGVGIDKITLCPEHRREVYQLILEMRKQQES